MENRDPSISEQIVRFYLNPDAPPIPEEVYAYARDCVLDYLGCAIGGANSDEHAVRLRELYAPARHPGRSAVANGGLITAEFAAFVNGAASHALEMDDTTYEAGGHIAVSVISAALAVAGEVDAGGKDFLAAVIHGYDMVTRVGHGGVPNNIFERGWHPTSVNGVFGAAVAAGLLLGLDAKQLANAVGIAGGFASGNLECYEDGSFTKRLNPANAALSGVMAARIASTGFAGPKWVFEGGKGFLRSYTDDGVGLPERMLEDLDYSRHYILRSAFKPYACCRYNHTPVDGVIGILAENKLTAADIEKITVDVCSMAVRGVVEPRAIKYNPTTVVAAQFSLPFAVSVAALFRNASVNEHTEAKLNDPAVRDMMQRVEMISTGAMNQWQPLDTAANVTILTKDGRTFTKLTRTSRGDPQNPFTAEELKTKFLSLAGMSFSKERAQAVYEAVQKLDTLPVRELGTLLTARA